MASVGLDLARTASPGLPRYIAVRWPKARTYPFGAEPAFLERQDAMARRRAESVERGPDPDGDKTITLPNGRRIGYWPDYPGELDRDRRMVTDAGFDPKQHGL